LTAYTLYDKKLIRVKLNCHEHLHFLQPVLNFRDLYTLYDKKLIRVKLNCHEHLHFLQPVLNFRDLFLGF